MVVDMKEVHGAQFVALEQVHRQRVTIDAFGPRPIHL